MFGGISKLTISCLAGLSILPSRGMGTMECLETKVDIEVRNAREIQASELLRPVQKLWRGHFLPHNLRAEPIFDSQLVHPSGPGGHFKLLLDTPETSLVGTFSVAYEGDTSSTSAGHFRIGEKTLTAKPCSWVVFHPYHETGGWLSCHAGRSFAWPTTSPMYFLRNSRLA